MLLGVMLCLSCRQALPARTEYVLGTFCTVNLYEKGTKDLYDDIFGLLRELEEILSANKDTSNIASINAASGKSPVKAHPDTLAVLKRALRYAEISGGKFDPSVGPLVKAWNIGTEYASIPEPEELTRVLSLVNHKDILIDEAAGTVFLTQEGMRLDLGAIAKGYAADQIINLLDERKVERAIIDLGGNVYARGEKAPGLPWKVGIRNPETGTSGAIIALKVKNKTIVTSGINERYFEKDGTHYHHILDPATGYPAQSGLLSVTIISDSSIDADALSTTCFILGAERGLSLVKSIPGTDALFITTDRKIIMTDGLAGLVEILDSTFTL